MAKKRRERVFKKQSSRKVITLFFVSLLVFAGVLWVTNHGENILGLSTSDSRTEVQDGTRVQQDQVEPTLTQPTTANIQQPTLTQLQATNYPLPTDTPPAAQPSPSPTPTPITPDKPIYVTVVDAVQTVSQIDIAQSSQTVIIENTPTGIQTSTQELVVKNEPIMANTSARINLLVESTIDTSRTTVAQSPLESVVSLFTGGIRPAPPQLTGKTTDVNVPPSGPLVYQQLYIAATQTPSYVVDTQQTLRAIDQWLGLNDIAMTAQTGAFTIAQGKHVARMLPTGNKIAVNLSRMELLVNTPLGFKPLSYTVGWAIDYLKDLNVISEVDGEVIVRDTATELVYDIKGISSQYFLAFIPVPVQKEVCISAKTGEVCGIKQSTSSKVLDMLSI